MEGDGVGESNENGLHTWTEFSAKEINNKGFINTYIQLAKVLKLKHFSEGIMTLSVKLKCSSCFAINQPLLGRACTDMHGSSWKLGLGQWGAEAILRGQLSKCRHIHAVENDKTVNHSA